MTSLSSERAKVARILEADMKSYIDNMFSTLAEYKARLSEEDDPDDWWDEHLMTDLTHICEHYQDDEGFCKLGIERVSEIVSGFQKKKYKGGDRDLIKFFMHVSNFIEALEVNDSAAIMFNFNRCNEIWRWQLASCTIVPDLVPSGISFMQGCMIEMVELEELGSYWYSGDPDGAVAGHDCDMFGYVRKHKRKRAS
jgi:hypothetical protein